MDSTPKTRSKNELLVLDVGLSVLFLAATILQAHAACDPRSNCERCYDNGSCITCRTGYGYQNRTGYCEPCGLDCLECSPIGGNCTRCSVGYGPAFKSGNASCGPCLRDNCDAGCSVYGAGTCDRCNDRYGPIPATINCTKCIEHCQSCPANTSQCESCDFGYAVFDPGNKSCGACSKYCTISGCFNRGPGACDRCDPGYVYFRNNFTCGGCAPNCSSCVVRGAGQCDNCTFGYGLTPTNTCEPCSAHCTRYGCNITGAKKCDRCDFGYGLLPNGSCDSCSKYCNKTGCAIEGAGECDEYDPGYVFFRNNKTCGVLEVGLGLGVPCGFIIIVLLIIIMVMCVQNRSLREYKRQSQDSRQSHTMLYSTASNATLQPPSTQYQHLKTQNTQREYEGIDRYDTISTTETETTGHYETPMN